jgi:Eukaryotic protein of unknown function (DUF829)
MTLLLPGRPVVVLAGWLGCQPKSLRRYEALYQTFGFGVVSRIATPLMVVMAARTNHGTTRRERSSSRRGNWQPATTTTTTMQELGWDVVETLLHSQCSLVIFHGFSNGGCFLWEQIKNILNTTPDDHDTNIILQSLRSKIVGVVFDSSPAYFHPKDHNKLDDALQYCRWQERLQITLHQWMHPVRPQDATTRATTYWEKMRNDPWEIRQLYLYSTDDALTPYQPLEELIHHRQQLFGTHRILAKSWISSPHCTHLMTHQDDYQDAVTSFLHLCLHATPKSKL